VTEKEFWKFKRYCIGDQEFINVLAPTYRTDGWYYFTDREIFVHYVNGRRHNTRGPTQYWINLHGDFCFSYSLRGTHCCEKEWNLHPEVMEQKMKTIMSVEP